MHCQLQNYILLNKMSVSKHVCFIHGLYAGNYGGKLQIIQEENKMEILDSLNMTYFFRHIFF